MSCLPDEDPVCPAEARKKTKSAARLEVAFILNQAIHNCCSSWGNGVQLTQQIPTSLHNLSNRRDSRWHPQSGFPSLPRQRPGMLELE